METAEQEVGVSDGLDEKLLSDGTLITLAMLYIPTCALPQ